MCFKSRKKPACIVGILSGAILIISIGMFTSVKFAGADVFEVFKDDEDEIRKLKSILSFALMSFAGLTLVLGVWGLCLLKIKNRCCPVCFGVLLLPAWILSFVFGSVIVWFSN